MHRKKEQCMLAHALTKAWTRPFADRKGTRYGQAGPPAGGMQVAAATPPSPPPAPNPQVLITALAQPLTSFQTPPHSTRLQGQLPSGRDDEGAQPVQRSPPLTIQPLEHLHRCAGLHGMPRSSGALWRGHGCVSGCSWRHAPHATDLPCNPPLSTRKLTGIRNARVLPDPVLAAPRTSLPARACGSTALCTAVGWVNPAAASPALVFRDRGKPSNWRAPAQVAGSLVDGGSVRGLVPGLGAWASSRPCNSAISSASRALRLRCRAWCWLWGLRAMIHIPNQLHTPFTLMCMNRLVPKAVSSAWPVAFDMHGSPTSPARPGEVISSAHPRSELPCFALRLPCAFSPRPGM